MQVKSLIKMLLDCDMEAEVFFETDIPNPEEFDLLAVNSIMEVEEGDEDLPMVILSPEIYADHTLN